VFKEQYSHEPNIAVARFWELAGIHAPEAELEAKRRGGIAALEAMEGHLSGHEFLVGDRYSIADIALYAYTHVAPEGGFSLERYPAIREWLTRVAADPDHIPITD
jgi:glutathione S-transferase